MVYTSITIIFYKERLFADSAFYLFTIINNHTIFIPHERYLSCIPQLPVLVGIYLGLSLKSLAIIASLSYSMMLTIPYIIIAIYLKRPYEALIITLFACVGISNLFFWQVSELFSALTIGLLLFIIIKESNNKVLFIVINILYILLILYYHTLVYIGLLLYYYSVYVQNNKNYKKEILTITLITITFLLKLYFNKDIYENELLHIRNNINIFEIIQIIIYWVYYKIVLLSIIIISIIMLIKLKNQNIYKYIVNIYIFPIILYVLLLNIVYKAYYNNFYVDNLYLPLNIYICYIFIVILKKYINIYKKVILTIPIILGTSLFLIIIASFKYSDRVNYCYDIQTRISDSTMQKIIVSDSIICGESGNWSFPVETLIQTSLNGKPISIVPIDVFCKAILTKTLSDSDFIVAPWITLQESSLNKKYFNINTNKYFFLDSLINNW